MSRTVAILALAASATIAVPLHAAGASAAGSAGTRMLRSPTVSATQIAFAAQNIWAVDRAGGVARRLTSFQGQASNPHFSPDGKRVAYRENWPKDVIAGHDPQLEKAVEVAMKELQEHPVTRMMKEPAPPRPACARAAARRSEPKRNRTSTPPSFPTTRRIP